MCVYVCYARSCMLLCVCCICMFCVCICMLCTIFVYVCACVCVYMCVCVLVYMSLSDTHLSSMLSSAILAAFSKPGIEVCAYYAIINFRSVYVVHTSLCLFPCVISNEHTHTHTQVTSNKYIRMHTYAHTYTHIHTHTIHTHTITDLLCLSLKLRCFLNFVSEVMYIRTRLAIKTES